MGMPKNDLEVFEYLISNEKDAPQISFMTYAIFAHEKKEWIEHFKVQHSKQIPNQADIDSWISNLTASQFVSMRGEAERFFAVAATELFEERLEEERKKILRSAIVSEVKAAGSFWKQFAIAILTAILAPLIIGAVIASALMFDAKMPTSKLISHLFSIDMDTNRSATPKSGIEQPQPP